MLRPGRKRPKQCRLSVSLRAAEQLRAIHSANSSDPTYVIRMEAESEGFSLWLGPEVAGDVVLGSEDTYQLRASPEQARYMADESLIVDFWEKSPAGPRLIVYREGEPPPHLESLEECKSSEVSRQPKEKREMAVSTSKPRKGVAHGKTRKLRLTGPKKAKR